ncbi:von Willebrand factor type A domain-containing protein [Dactylosporangium sp. NPDC005572]|uniref:vWA domain-containing protein n=1 Tax=Dactylosporangium sp. NPDC005572 TaxID=3156889 RepID=UPI0033AD4D83
MVSGKLKVLAVAAAVTVGLAACGADDAPSSSSDKAAGAGAPAATAYGAPGPANTTAAVVEERSTGERRTVDQAISTFAVDVDTASYGFAKRQLLAGQRPAANTIRPEEFVNSFRQGYRAPSGNGFAVNADGVRLPGTHRGADETARLLRIGLQTSAAPSGERRDAQLTFVVDVSGSMAEAGKLDLVQHGLHTLVDQLRSTDSVAIVAYSDNADVLRPMTAVRDRGALHTAIDRLRIAGSTNLEAGLFKGYDIARNAFRTDATNRVILLSDGLPNVGSTDATSLVREVQEAAAKQITMMGVGVGSDYGDKFMEQLADKGDGYVVYVSERDEAARIFVEQLPAALSVRALDAKAQVEFNSQTVLSYRLIGYDNRTLSASQFRDDHVDGGEVGPGHAVTALYALHLRPGAEGHLADVRVRWLDPRTKEATEILQPVAVSAVDGDLTVANVPLRVCYVAAYLAEVLRSSQYGSEVRLPDLLSLVQAARRNSDDPQVAELERVVEAAVKLYS